MVIPSFISKKKKKKKKKKKGYGNKFCFKLLVTSNIKLT